MRSIIAIFIFININCFTQKKQIKLSHNGGVYNDTFSLKIDLNNKNTTVYYTFDGSNPSKNSFKYEKPIFIDSIKTLRFVAYNINDEKIEETTQTFFIKKKFFLPIISIQANPKDLWSYEKGIYSKGCCAKPNQPYYGANFWEKREIPANIEMYEKDGKLAINQNVGIRIFGGWSKCLPQKSLAIIARKKYGLKRIKYKLFPNLKIKKFKSFILRNSGGDFNKGHIRDAFMTQLIKPIDIEIQEQRPVIVYLNGKYFGIQYIREKINEHYLKSHFNYINKDSVSILKHRKDVQHGKRLNYLDIISFIKKNHFNNEKNIKYLDSLIDIKNFISYNISETYSDNKDAGGNIRFWKTYSTKSKWRWIFFDLDLSLSNNSKNGYKNNTIKKFTSINNEKWPDPPWSTLIIRKLLENKKIKELYINTFLDYLNSIFEEKKAKNILDTMVLEIEKEMPNHKKKWGGSLNQWKKEIKKIEEFVKNRPKYLRKFLIQKFNLDTIANIIINVPKKEIANIQLNSLKLNKKFEGKYIKNHPIYLYVEPTIDYNFDGWKEIKISKKILNFLPKKDTTIFTPQFSTKKESIFHSKIIINEIYIEKNSCIEIYNKSNKDINISHFIIKNKKEKNTFELPKKSIIKAKSFIVISQKKIPSIPNNIYGIEFNFSNNDKIRIYDKKKYKIDEVKIKNSKKNNSWALINPEKKSKNNWCFQKPSLGKINHSYLEFLYKQKKEEKNQKITFFSIIGVIIIVTIFIYFIIRKKSNIN